VKDAVPQAEIAVTANFRAVHRDGGMVVQQRCFVTVDAGTVKERTTYVWLDVEHAMFAAVESPAEIKAREEVERMRVRIRI
jgi:hypothetical protein